MTGDSMDRVGSVEMLECLTNLAKVYNLLGRRFKYLEIELSDFSIDWLACGPWKLKSQAVVEGEDNYKVTMILKKWASPSRQEIEFVLDKVVFFDDVGPFALRNAFSVKQAYLESASTKDTYSLMSTVPGLSRRLNRRPSDEVGATNAARMTYSDALMSLKDKRASAKAKRSGIVGLSGGPPPKAANPTSVDLTAANLVAHQQQPQGPPASQPQGEADASIAAEVAAHVPKNAGKAGASGAAIPPKPSSITTVVNLSALIGDTPVAGSGPLDVAAPALGIESPPPPPESDTE